MSIQWSENQVAQEVESLARLVALEMTGDPKTGRSFGERLDRLRGLFRAEPRLFSPALIASLKQLSSSLHPPNSFTPTNAQEIMQSTFGYSSFRPGQEEIIHAVLSGRDCIGVMPTGAGKSLTYQIPARILSGTTLVISPLIALMKNQVDALTEIGIRATFINSSLSAAERRELASHRPRERVRRDIEEGAEIAPLLLHPRRRALDGPRRGPPLGLARRAAAPRA